MDGISQGTYVGTDVGRIKCCTYVTVDNNIESFMLKPWCVSVNGHMIGTSSDTET